MGQQKHPQPVDTETRMARNWPSMLLLIIATIEVALGFWSDPRMFAFAGLAALMAVVAVLVDINEYLHEIARRGDNEAVQRQLTDTPE